MSGTILAIVDYDETQWAHELNIVERGGNVELTEPEAQIVRDYRKAQRAYRELARRKYEQLVGSNAP